MRRTVQLALLAVLALPASAPAGPAKISPKASAIVNDTTNDDLASARGETRSMVRHPGLLEGVSLDTHTFSAGPDRPHRYVRNVPGHVT